MPQLCVGNQAHPYDWDVASCSRKYKYEINSLYYSSVCPYTQACWNRIIIVIVGFVFGVVWCVDCTGLQYNDIRVRDE